MYDRNLIQIIKSLTLISRSEGATINQLVLALDTSRRTVFRILKTLSEELDFPLTTTREDFGGETTYFLEAGFAYKLSNVNLPRLSLSLTEASLLYFLLGRDTLWARTDFSPDLASLKDKLSAFLPTAFLTKHADARLDSIFAASPAALKSYEGLEPLIDTVLDALEYRLCCSLSYKRAGNNEARSFDIHPLKIIEHRGGLYLFVRIPKHDSIRIIAIDRIISVEVSTDTFDYPEDFDAEALLATAFDLTFDDPVTATIRFSAKDAPYVKERRYSREQVFEDHPDGSTTLTITTSGSEDLLRWILSFGSGAEVLSPPELRQRAASEIAKARSLYPDIL